MKAIDLKAITPPQLPADPGTGAPLPCVERVGRYQLCYELASGGMATVYLARDASAGGSDKLLALKRIHRNLARKREYVEMFLDEARIAARITHANVCSVFDFGETDGEYFMVMEYLVGEPLSEVRERLTQNAVLANSPELPLLMARIVAEAAEGLHAAHSLKDVNGDSLNVVHRDVSPRNLFVTYDGAVQVVDFGIASARDRQHETAAGSVKGSFPYMAPEQIESARNVDHRTDVWGLGVVLWEMLTNRRLFKRDSDMATMFAVMTDKVLPPSHYNHHVPASLDEIVLKALSRDRSARYQTARDLGRELSCCIAEQSVAMGAAELSEWMGSLFPNGEAQKRELMARARLTAPPPPRVPQIPEHSGEFLSPRRRRAGSAPTVLPPAPVPPRRRSEGQELALMFGGGAIVAFVVAIAVMLAS